jgi:hypothetical protein
LAAHNFDKITAELRNNILAFYSDPAAPIHTKKNPKSWEKTQAELEKLRALPEPSPLEPKFTSDIELEIDGISEQIMSDEGGLDQTSTALPTDTAVSP